MTTDKKRSFDGDKLRRASMWLLAAGVAAIAAIVSYSHIYDLGRAHGGSGTAARLLPLSVDMLILVGELMLLHEADVKGRRFVLGWVLVWSGVLATLAANVTYGAQYGAAGALIWGWPAYSFILAASGMVAVVKRGAARDDADSEPACDGDTDDRDQRHDGDTDRDEDSDTDRRDERQDRDSDSDSDSDAGDDEKERRERQRQASGSDKVRDILKRHPALRKRLLEGDVATRKAAKAEVAEKAGVTVRTVERVMTAASGTS